MSDKNSERLDAWIFFNDGKCDEDKQLFVDDIKDLKQKLEAAEERERVLREAVEHCVDDIIAISPDSERNTVCLSLVEDILEQALEKVKRDGE